MTTAIIIITAACIVIVLLMAASGLFAKHEANRPPNSDDADEHFAPREERK